MRLNNDLFSVLTSEERTQFARYLMNRDRRGDAKNRVLLQAMIDGQEDQLKAKMGSNAYNVLRNRMKHRMIDFIAQSTLQKEGSDGESLTRTFVTARRLLKHSKYQSAFKILLKLEQEAFEKENYTLEGEVQQLLIGHAHLPHAPQLDDLYLRSKRNHDLQQSKTRLNLAYARIRMAYQAVEFQGEEIDLSELIESTFAEFSVSNETAFRFSSLRQLVHLADIYGSYTKNYHRVNLFFTEKLNELQGSQYDNKENVYDHIEILYTIANIYFRKKDFGTSNEFLRQMKVQMTRFGAQPLAEHELKWAMLNALNLNHMGQSTEARQHVDSVLNRGFSSDQTTQIRLALAMLQIQQKEFRDCQRTLSKLSHTDSWYEKNLGIEWTLHKLTLEILLHIDLENYDYAESRLKSLLRKYKKHLNTDGKNQDKPFLQLILVILRDPSTVHSEVFVEKVESSIQWKNVEEEDVFRMNFYAWLKAKMSHQDVYPTLLKLFERT